MLYEPSFRINHIFHVRRSSVSLDPKICCLLDLVHGNLVFFRLKVQKLHNIQKIGRDFLQGALCSPLRGSVLKVGATFAEEWTIPVPRQRVVANKQSFKHGRATSLNDQTNYLWLCLG